MIACESIYGNQVMIPEEKLAFRPSVYGLVEHEDRVLLLRGRSSGKLHLPGGGVEMAERLDQALRRELREETGLEIEVGAFLYFEEAFFYYDPLDEAFHTFCFFYRCRPLTFDLLADSDVDDAESQQPRWYDLATLDLDDVQTFSRTAILRLRERHPLG